MADVQIGSDEIEEVESEIARFAMFKRLGASTAVGMPKPPPGNASLLTVSNIYGATFFAGAKGLYAARTATLIKLFEAAKSSGKSDISEGAEDVFEVADLGGIHTLSLSADELLLAVCVKDRVLIFSTQDLIEQKSKAPRRTFDLSARSLAWSPSDARSLLVLLNDDTLRVADVSKGAEGPSRGAVEAAAWAPDGLHVAFASAEGIISIAKPDLSTVIRTIAPTLSVRGTEDAARVKIDTVRWIRPSSMLLSLVPFTDDGVEESDSPLVALETDGASFADSSGQVKEVLLDGLSPSILNDATEPNLGPYLHSAFVKEWNVVIVANRKSYDDHLNLVGWREQSLRQWQIEDDTWIPRVDMTESGDDNFVVGLAIDRTSTQIQLFDPRDSSGETKLPPQPIMLYATSEGTLNAFVFARLDEANSVQNLVASPRPSFAPLEDAFHEEPTPATAQETSARPPDQEHAAQRKDDVSRLRQQAAEAAERRAAEAKAGQQHALPPGDDDDEELSEESLEQAEPSSDNEAASRARQSEASEDSENGQSDSGHSLPSKATSVPLPTIDGSETAGNREVKEPNPEMQTSKEPFAAQPPVPAFLPGSEGKQVIKSLEKAGKTTAEKPGFFATQPPLPSFLPGLEGKQVIKVKEKTDALKQISDSFAAQPPVPAFLPGSEGKQVIKQLEITQKPGDKGGHFAAQPPIPAFLPGSEGKQVIKPLQQTQKAEKPGLFAAQPPIPTFLPGSEGKQVIKPVSKTPGDLTTSLFGSTQPKPSTSADDSKSTPPLFAPSPSFGSTQSKTASSPFGAFATSSASFGASSGAFGASTNAFGQFPSTPFSFSTGGLGQESGRLTPAFGASVSSAGSAASVKPEASMSKSGEPGKPVSDKPGGFAGFSGGFKAFAKPASEALSVQAQETVSAHQGMKSAHRETKSAHKEEAPQLIPESPKSLAPRKPSSPKRGHSSTDLQAEGEAGSFSLDQVHVKRTAVRTRGAGPAGKRAPQEAGKAAQGPDLEAEFVKELEEVQQMAAELDALLGPLESSSNHSADAVLSQKSLEALFRSTFSLFQSCQALREQATGASERVQGLMSDTHQADAWRIVLESKVEQAKDERFRILWDKKNLEPKVEAQRKSMLAKDQALKDKVADLQIHLQSLEIAQKPAVKETRTRGSLRKDRLYGRNEATHQQHKPNRPSVRSLYSTVITQMAIAEEQSLRLSHLMRQLGFKEPPPKQGAKGTPRAEEILRSLDISPARRSPNQDGTRGKTPGSSGRKTLKGGTVFRAPNFDDDTDDVTSGSSPAPKQRLTYSPAEGAKTPGTGAPPSGRRSPSPGMGARSPQSERRSARKGLSEYHVPTTTIKRGAQQRANPASPIAYQGAIAGRRSSLAAEPSEESDNEDDDTTEYEARHSFRPLAGNSFQVKGGGVSQSAAPATAPPPVAERRASGGQKTGEKRPPARRTTSGPGEEAPQTPEQKPAEPANAQAKTPLGDFSFSKVGPSGFGQASLPAFEGFSFSTSARVSSTKPASKAGVNLLESGAKPLPFPAFGSSSSKPASGAAPESKFDVGGSKLVSSTSAPVQIVTKPLTQPELSPTVKLTPTKPEPGPFSTPLKSSRESRLRSRESETETISDDEDQSKKDSKLKVSGQRDSKDRADNPEGVPKKEREGQVSKEETATSKAGASTPSFGGFSAFAKPSAPFSFSMPSEAPKTPNPFAAQSAIATSLQQADSDANQTPKPSEAKSSASSEPSENDKFPKPSSFKPPQTSAPPTFHFSLAPRETPSGAEKEVKESTESKKASNDTTEEVASLPETSVQERAPAETTKGQSGEEAKLTPLETGQSTEALDTRVAQQAPPSTSVASPVSSAPTPLFQIPQMQVSKAKQASAAVPTPASVSPSSQQTSASPAPFSFASASAASSNVNTSSPFSFAQTPSVSPSLNPSQTPEESEESMDEEGTAPEGALSGFGGFGGFGLGSATPSTSSKLNPFGVTSLGAAPPAISSPPSDPNALFKPASFALPGGSSPFAPNPSTPKPAFGNQGSPFGAASSGSGFGQPATPFGQSLSAFGQPASPGFGGAGFGQQVSPGFGSPGQIGSATSSNQVIGGIVGGFGQSRTLGPGLPGVAQGPAFGSAPTAGAFGSFAAKPSGGFGGFAGQAAGGGFATAGSSGGSGFGGFGGAPAGGGFSGFAGAASQGAGGFGGLNSSPTFGGPPAGGDPRFTQMRK